MGAGGSLLVPGLPQRPFPWIRNSLHWHRDPLPCHEDPLPASRALSPWNRNPLPWLLPRQHRTNPTLESCGAKEAGNPLINNGLEKWNYIPSSGIES